MFLLCTGCAARQADITLGTLTPGSSEEENAVRANPLAYLRDSERRAAGLTQYQLLFMRQERLGLVPSLRPAERMRADFRAEPFSVKFTWVGEDSEYRECVYFAGRNDNKVVLLPRRGLLGLPASPGSFDPMDGVRFWKTRNPITDFGVHRMIVRTLKRIEDAAPHGGAKLRYVGLRDLEGTPARHFEMLYPAGDAFPSKRQDLFVEVASGIPLGTHLWLPSGELDATYLYLERRVPAKPLGDDVFTLSHPPKGRGRATKTGKG